MNNKQRLFTYIIPIDDGAAPNPWGGYCTLNICKPAIRRVAKKSDWVMGTGGKNIEGHGDLRGKCVYLMQVTHQIKMSEYDNWAIQHAPIKIVDFGHADWKKRLGDAIYDFSTENPTLRKSVHTENNRDTDLGGKNTLISENFIYFGDKAIDLPEDLLGVVLQGQGHRSTVNESYLDPFLHWKDELFKEYGENKLLGQPQLDVVNILNSNCESLCQARAKTRLTCAVNDKEIN